MKSDYEEETNTAASFLIREWVEKLLGVKFNSLRDLAVYLIDKMYVDNRSTAAFTVISAMKKSGEGKMQCNRFNTLSCDKMFYPIFPYDAFLHFYINLIVQDSKSQLFNGGEAAMEMQEHKRKIEV